MDHMTIPGQTPNERLQAFAGFRTRDTMPFPQFDPKQATKDFIPPDPLMMQTGLYIPPEETAAPMTTSLADIMSWQSEDEQQDTDDEEGNEFDMEFDDPDSLLLPRMAAPQPTPNAVCERHLSQPSFSAFESVPYTPRRHEHAAMAPILTRHEYERQPGYEAPFNFIDPSSLQLKTPPTYSTAYTNPHQSITRPDSQAEPAPSNEEAEVTASDELDLRPMVSAPLELEDDKTLEEIGLGLDVDMDFVFNEDPVSPDSGAPYNAPHLVSPMHSPSMDMNLNTPGLKIEPQAESQQHSAQHGYPLVEHYEIEQQNQEPQAYPQQQYTQPLDLDLSPVSPEAEEIENIKPEHTELRSPPVSVEEYKGASESPAPAVAPTSEASSPADSAWAALSPPPEKLRKRAVRRAPKSSAASHHYGGSHVCNMVFSDGKECHRSFTRPYDLARHQETIHAPVRKTYKCDACGERSKTFSRLDALSRHVRLKHAAQ